MPDLIARESFEEELAAALLLSWDGVRSTIIEDGTTPPNWAQMENDIRLRADAVLQGASVAAAILLYQQLTQREILSIPPAFNPPQGQAQGLATSLTQVRQDEYVQARGSGEWDPQAFVDRWMSPSSATSIATTEVTAAVSAGEEALRQQMENLGVQMVAVWNNDPRSNVCEICLALDGQEESEWPPEARPGPPRHPNCRCFLTYRPAS